MKPEQLIEALKSMVVRQCAVSVLDLIEALA
jgi:hypothetical protein